MSELSYILAVFDPMTFIIWMIIMIGISYAISQMMSKGQKSPNVEPDQFKLPDIREGTEYTINFGTNWVENSVADWWGDFKTDAIIRTEKTRSLFGSKKVSYVVGYHYAVGMNLIIAQGQQDGVKQIRVGDKVVWPNPDDVEAWQADGASSAVIDEPNIFGGNDREGGVVGTVTFHYGASTQARDTYLTEHAAADITAYRGLTTAVLEQVRYGTSAYMKPWKFLIKRTDIKTDGTAQWYAAKSDIGNTMNAVHIIRECLTNEEWGMSISSSLFPSVTWEGAADTLYSEEFGLNLKWESQTMTLKEFVEDVLRHIDAVLYEDPTNGEIIIKLIRFDYTPSALDVYDASDIIRVKDYGCGTIHEAINYVSLKFWDTIYNKPISLPDQDIALMDMQNGKLIPHKIEYLGIANSDLAGKVLARDRKQLTSFAYTMKMDGKRTMSGLTPGDVFKMVWPVLGIEEMIVRVLEINYGTLKDGPVRLTCTQDVFSVETALFGNPPITGWTPPHFDPIDVTDYKIGEAPFYEILNEFGITGGLGLDAASDFLQVLATKTSPDAYDFELYLRDGVTDPFYTVGRGYFCPSGTINADVPLNAVNVTLTLENVDSLDNVAVGTYAIIDYEIVKVLSVTPASNQVQVARGCLDTAPAAHSGPDSGGDGTRIWFAGTTSFIAGREFTDGDVPGVKMLTRTGVGELAIGSATAHNATAFDSRQARPYLPGNFKVNNNSYPATFSGQPTLTWTHRDRTQQVTEIVEHSASSIGPEAGTTYTLTIYDENNVQRRQVTSLSGVAYTYQEADELSDCGLSSAGELNSKLRFVLKSVRDGLDSWQEYDIWVNRA